MDDYSRNRDFVTEKEEERYEVNRGTIRSYLIGFVLSIILTVMAYLFVVGSTGLSNFNIVVAILWCAVAQLLVQMVFFLHLGSGSRPRWNLTVFILMAVILVIIVGGSLWIMTNLNAHMMPESTMDMNGFVLPKQ